MRAVQSRVLYALSVLFLATLCQAQTGSESKIDLAPYGFVKSSCVWYPGDVEFLDDEHLVLSAPVMTKCDKSLWDSPTDTTITVINLKGEKVASSHRSDVIRMSTGPTGYVSVCVGNHVELLSVSLQVSESIPLTAGRTVSRCSFYGRLTPSRNAMVISGPGHHEFTIYRVSPAGSTRIEIPTGYNVRAVADDGLLLCKNVQCEVFGSAGVLRRFPSLEGAYDVDIKGLVSQDRLLVADRDGKRLYTIERWPTYPKLNRHSSIAATASYRLLNRVVCFTASMDASWETSTTVMGIYFIVSPSSTRRTVSYFFATAMLRGRT
jgi:hypothetical protein